ncbi:unnamed protein product [Pleuronectes platessa]|uniref:Uncharacterized protein n=1 Tax=Pleuronectes platessa TaxID=8262 RepID=A0A9N7V852_PLEPL|nr:unnamed protein product [Pleuronectes platessa]
MLHRIFLLCLGLSVAGSALSCRWMDHKFKQLSENSLDLLEMMAHNSTNSTEDVEVSFPEDLLRIKLALTVQVLEEVVLLFEEDHSAASWDERRLEDFLNVMSRQAVGLRSCDYSAESWELIRKEIKVHLMRSDLLLSSLLADN